MSLSDGNLVTFSYDDAYSLTREQRSGAAAYDITYTYDATGNRTGKLAGGTTTTYTVDAADRLTVENAAGTLTTYSFDAAGNNTAVNAAGALTTYTWDLTNRMTGLADAGGVTTLVSDATGLRRAKQDASGTTQFLWDGQTLLLEADGGGTTQAHYTAGPGGYGPLVAQRRGTTSSFYHPTDLGTIEALTDASGSVTDSYAFTAFGVPVATSGTTVNPHRYVGALGYCTDPTTDLAYVRARYLRPATGSWLSVDPVPSEPRYQYVGGRATRATDADGLRSPAGYVPGETGPPLADYDYPRGFPDRPYAPEPEPIPSHNIIVINTARSKMIAAWAVLRTPVGSSVLVTDSFPEEPMPVIDEVMLCGHSTSEEAVIGEVTPDLLWCRCGGPPQFIFPNATDLVLWGCHAGGEPAFSKWCKYVPSSVWIVAPPHFCSSWGLQLHPNQGLSCRYGTCDDARPHRYPGQ